MTNNPNEVLEQILDFVPISRLNTEIYIAFIQGQRHY